LDLQAAAALTPLWRMGARTSADVMRSQYLGEAGGTAVQRFAPEQILDDREQLLAGSAACRAIPVCGVYKRPCGTVFSMGKIIIMNIGLTLII